jgi:hypothetical protein
MTSSTILANTIQNTSSKDILRSTGSILQTVFSTALNSGRGGSVSTTSASYVTTGISAIITPISASSKLYVRFTGSLHFFGPGAGDDGIACRIYRDGTTINSGNDMLFYRSDANGNTQLVNTKITHYVNANNTNPTKFELYFVASWAGTANINYDWSAPNFLIMEVSA